MVTSFLQLFLRYYFYNFFLLLFTTYTVKFYDALTFFDIVFICKQSGNLKNTTQNSSQTLDIVIAIHLLIRLLRNFNFLHEY